MTNKFSIREGDEVDGAPHHSLDCMSYSQKPTIVRQTLVIPFCCFLIPPAKQYTKCHILKFQISENKPTCHYFINKEKFLDLLFDFQKLKCTTSSCKARESCRSNKHCDPHCFAWNRETHGEREPALGVCFKSNYSESLFKSEQLMFRMFRAVFFF